jgi:poly(beta-D-mannuronate) lyase
MEGLNGTRWDAPITLTMGDAIDGQSSSLSKHFRAERVTIAYNTLVNNSHGIEIGYDNNDNYNKDLKDITITNNLITSSENSLVEIVDTDNDQGDEITWLSNLMYPTEGASILTGASSTSFDATAAINENPHLVFDDISNVWQTSSDSPLYENAVISQTINEDINGQNRPNISNPGADHYSLESIRFRPIIPADVGPDAYNTITSNSNIVEWNAPLLYPVPTDNTLYLSNIDNQINQVEILNLEGKTLLSRRLENDESDLRINTTRFLNGIYIVRFLKDDGKSESKNFVVQH